MKKSFFAFVVLVVALLTAARARAYTPPPMTAHVTDTAGVLTEAQRLAIDRKLEDYRLRTTNEIAVFLPKSLEGESIEDVANKTARTWKLGLVEKENGVLLVIAPAERRARIENNRGVEGAITDLQANDIIRGKIRPRLVPGHEDYAAAVTDATDAIMAALDAGGVGGGTATTKTSGARAPPRPADAGDVLFALVFLAIVIGVPILLLVVFIRGIASAFSSHGRSASTGWASGSSWTSNSSWSSSSSDSSWSSSSSSDSSFGGGGGGDSGFTGGGSDTFSGGGSSDSF